MFADDTQLFNKNDESVKKKKEGEEKTLQKIQVITSEALRSSP
jgi:hypothetical protein